MLTNLWPEYVYLLLYILYSYSNIFDETSNGPKLPYDLKQP